MHVQDGQSIRTTSAVLGHQQGTHVIGSIDQGGSNRLRRRRARGGGGVVGEAEGARHRGGRIACTAHGHQSSKNGGSGQ
jgi:hypothetical protein